MVCRIMQEAIGVDRSVKHNAPDCFSIRMSYSPYIGLMAEKEVEKVALHLIYACPRHVKKAHFRF